MEEFDYTKSLSKLLQNQGYGTAEETAALHSVVEIMEKFPDFIFGEDYTISMKDLFLEKFLYREICVEDEDKFLHIWKRKANELVIKFAPRIKMWLDNFNDLFKFTVQLTVNDNQKFSNGSQNSYYLNPTTANTGVQKTIVVDEENHTTTTTFSGGNLKVQDIDTNDNSGEKNRTITRDVLQSVWGKTRADIMNKILEIDDVYNTCIKEFEVLFMGVL